MFLVKSLTLFVMPLGFALAVGLLALALWRDWRAARLLLVVQLIVLAVGSMPFAANRLALWWESGFPPVPVDASASAGAVVILGGVLGSVRPPRLVPDLVASSDRVLHAARLYRADKAPLVIASGGNLPWLDDGVSEAQLIRDLLVEWGVDASAVLLEERSRNTRENALETASLVRSEGVDEVLLVTSAWHMRRAIGTFRVVGVEVIPSPTDVQGVVSDPNLLDFLPRADALALTTTIVKEMLGMLYYRWREWL